MQNSSKALVVLCSLYVCVAIFLCRGFPPVNSDEVVRTLMGQQRIHGETPRYSLYDDIFARPVYVLRDAVPDISLTIYHLWLGAWSSLKPSSYMSSRLASIMAGLLALVMFYGVGHRLGGPRTAFCCAALAGFNPLFLAASSLARPETLLLATSAAVLWLTLSLPERISLKPFFIGGLAMLQMSIHPNASVICVGLFVFYLINLPMIDRLRKGLLFAAGASAGLLTVLMMVDIQRLWLAMHTVHAYLLRPPILIWPWTPLQWLRKTASVMWNGRTFYFDTIHATGWPICLRIWWIALIMFLVIAALQRDRDKEQSVLLRWILAGLAVIASTVVLVKAKECLYGTNVFPFLLPVAALGIVRAETSLSRAIRLIAVAFVGLSLCLFVRFWRLSRARIKPYAQIVSEVHALFPEQSLKVVGPNVLWFSQDKKLFRDSGAILISHWYMGGQPNLTDWLGTWQPDILILDDALRIALKKPASTQANLLPYLDRPVDFLGAVDTQGAYGMWEVYRIHWQNERRK